MTHPASAFDLPGWKHRLAETRQALGNGWAGGEPFAALVDGLVRELGCRAGWDGPNCAVAAQGGYGRGELAPRSDVDILFLVKNHGAAPPLDQVLYPLWDLGFEVGHALRTPRECADLARSDLTAATALMDARVLLGDAALMQSAWTRASIRPGGSPEMRRWAWRILEDVEERRIRFGEVSHLLEPHLKEGRGGLRDHQATVWVLRCLGAEVAESVRRLPETGPAAEAWRFVSRARAALHAAGGRKTDHLTFDYHREVAARTAPGEPLETFFSRLHRASHHLSTLWDEVAGAAHQALLPPRRRSMLREPLADPTLLARQVVDWLRGGGPLPEGLRMSIQRGVPAGVAEGLNLAAAAVVRNRIPLAPLLHELHHLGALGLLLPEVEAVAHEVQYDARHAFTTGIHCIETLRVAEDLWLGVYETREPHLTRVAAAVLRPASLRVAALCHDLAKNGTPDGHEQRGAETARQVAARFGLDTNEADEAVRLAALHGLLPEVAFREDLEDPAAVCRAREALGDPSLSDSLLALAFADLRATNPRRWSGVWSDWQRDLLFTLHARLQQGEERRPERLRRMRAAVLEGATAARRGHLEAAWERVPPREAAQVPADLLTRLLGLALELGEDPARFHVEPRCGGAWEVLGVARARPRLLSAATGALAGLGFDILSVQFHTWNDGTAHLWLRAAHPHEAPSATEVAERVLAEVARGARGGLPGASSLSDPRAEAVPVPSLVTLRRGENPFYTVLEVRCRDRRGLLAELSRSLEDLNLTVEYALVTTAGPMAQDVFHLKDALGRRVEGDDRLRLLLRRVDEVARGIPAG